MLTHAIARIRYAAETKQAREPILRAPLTTLK